MCMTLKVNVKVTQGQTSTLYAKCSESHGEYCSTGGMTFRVKVKVIQGQKYNLCVNSVGYEGSLAGVVG